MRVWTILIALLSVPSALLAQTVEPGATSQPLKMNQIQAIGTHNSYKITIPTAEMQVIASRSQAAATSLDYSHMPLNQQLDLGMRQLELDVFYDPKGGRYARPALAQMTRGRPGSVPYDATHMDRPGYKVLHAQDVDVRSHCPTFVMCLEQINAWSKAHPDHVPLLIMINAKDGASSVPFGVKALNYDGAAFDALDAEIRSIFGPERLITPDDVRGTAATLRDAISKKNWPGLNESRGKIFFALDEPPAKVATYMRGKASLEGLPMFVNSTGEDQPHAAYFTINHPVKQFDRIVAAVTSGFIVRTRADSEPAEAKANQPDRYNAALASGAHYISTDYPTPRSDFGPYQVRLPDGATARTNPITSPIEPK
jgi:hypothetical protein